MDHDDTAEHFSKKKVVFDMPGTDSVAVRRDVEFCGADGKPLAMDLYTPPDLERESRAPAVVIVSGYRDAGFQEKLGCRFKEMQPSVSWGRLIAASGTVAVTYTNREPVADLYALLRHLQQHAGALGIDGARVGVWASSGNAPTALALLMRDSPLRARRAAFCYGFTLDLDGATGVADSSRTYGFANPCAGKSAADLAADVPMFLARAGADQFPGLNDAMDRFAGKALAANLPITVVNHPTGPHAFDLFDDSDASREIVRAILGFLCR